ncbi:MAG: hypothetical protein ABR915_04285 [Thermoguttaceae bacterium]
MKPTLMAIVVAAWLSSIVTSAEVQVRTEDRTYPIVVNEGSTWPSVAKLYGKESYTTPAIILENEYLCAVVLPEFGGRLVEVKYKPTNQDLFWRNDKLLDRGPGRMGGGQWSFPFWEHCRHFDETCGYTIVRHAGGGATLAMDMRFDQFLQPEETRRYGRATNLRLVQTVHLDPATAALAWSARVENPLPIRCGFKLWWLLRQNARGGIQVIMPTAAVTGHGAPKLAPWDRDTVIRQGLVNSLFAIGIRHDFAGWYLPETDMNVLRLQDHRIAPGAKQVLYQPNPIGYIEMWGGNHEVFEECGRFSAVQARVKKTMPGGAGLYAEATDLVAEHGTSLPRAAEMNRQLLATSEDPQTLLDAARQLMRVKKDSIEVLVGLDKVLAREPGDPHANLYKAIWLLEAGKTAAAGCLEKAASLPGGRYLLALAAAAKKEYAAAEKHLAALLAMLPESTFRGQNDPGLALMQRGAIVTATRPRLLLAVVLAAQGKKEASDAVLRRLVDDDPALIEAWMLLDAADRLKTLTDRNPSGKAAAERTLDALRTGRWEGIGRP